MYLGLEAPDFKVQSQLSTSARAPYLTTFPSFSLLSQDFISPPLIMNALRDPSKKASITSLLNPQDASVAFPAHLPNLAASVNLGQPHDHQNGAVYGSSYPNGSSFNLRAANWDMADEAAKRKGEIGTRQYPPQMNPINGTMYPEGNVPRMARGRPEEAQQYPVSVQVWNAPPNGAHMSYGAPVIPSMYSDERTGKFLDAACDYLHHI